MARFPNVSCSNCGGSFGPGDAGFSHCQDHPGPRREAIERSAFDLYWALRHLLNNPRPDGSGSKVEPHNQSRWDDHDDAVEGAEKLVERIAESRT